jgi:hypothetical protein
MKSSLCCQSPVLAAAAAFQACALDMRGNAATHLRRSGRFYISRIAIVSPLPQSAPDALNYYLSVLPEKE